VLNTFIINKLNKQKTSKMERKTFQAVLVNPGYTSKNGNWTVVYRVDNATTDEVAKYKTFKGKYAGQVVDIVEVNGQMVECPLIWVDANVGNKIELIQTVKGNFIQDNSQMQNAMAIAKKYPLLAGAIANQAVQHLNLFGNSKAGAGVVVNEGENANLNGF
jgi:hypothetical protein